MKTCIVCEGGGMRGVFTAGVLQAFRDGGFIADILVGVSAGASNGANYVSGQDGRGYRMNVDYAKDPRYCSLQSYFKTGSVFGMDFLFDTIPNELDKFDYEAFHASSCDYMAGVTDVHTGDAVFFGKKDIDNRLLVLRASCSLPMFSPMVEINGRLYMDGGVAAPIPLEAAMKTGCDQLVVVLTQPRNFEKKPQPLRNIYQNMYKDYPGLVRAMRTRYLVYNHARQRLWRLEKAGRAIVICPEARLEVSRFGQNRDKLTSVYGLGLEAGKNALKII